MTEGLLVYHLKNDGRMMGVRIFSVKRWAPRDGKRWGHPSTKRQEMGTSINQEMGKEMGTSIN
jgi:hypothetical protein